MEYAEHMHGDSDVEDFFPFQPAVPFLKLVVIMMLYIFEASAMVRIFLMSSLVCVLLCLVSANVY